MSKQCFSKNEVQKMEMFQQKWNSKDGNVSGKMKFKRWNVPENAKFKRVFIRRTNFRKWYISKLWHSQHEMVQKCVISKTGLLSVPKQCLRNVTFLKYFTSLKGHFSKIFNFLKVTFFKHVLYDFWNVL